MTTHPLVLLVEPNPLLRRLIHGELKDVGCIVVDAPTDAAALAFAEIFPGSIDLALTDVSPGDGRCTFVTRLRALPAGRATRIIHLADTRSDFARNRHDTDRYLPTRFDRRGLLDALREALPEDIMPSLTSEPEPPSDDRAVFWGAERRVPAVGLAI